MVNTRVPGFQTIPIFMQTGAQEKPVEEAKAISHVVQDSPQKVSETYFNAACLCLV